MRITRDTEVVKPEKGLIAAEYVDPRELGPNSPVRDLARAFLQELRDKGRSETTLPRYARFLVEFLDFVGRDGAAPRVKDIDVRILKAYASHLTRRRLLSGRDAGKRPISAASKNLHLIALRGLLERYLRTRRDKDPALFVTRRRKVDGSYRMSVKMAQHIVAEAATRAGLTENVSPHWLRHAAITAWAKQESVPFAQRLAGHQNVATTSRYLGSTDAELKGRYKKRFG